MQVIMILQRVSVGF